MSWQWIERGNIDLQKMGKTKDMQE